MCVSSTDSASYDANKYSVAGFSSLQDMAESLVTEYNIMIDSIEKYGGFYIGRYELTGDGEKSGKPYSGTWYASYKKCTLVAKGESNTMTRMIWGNLWDATCYWLFSEGFSLWDKSNAMYRRK